MKLKEAFELVPKKLIGSPTIVYQKNNTLFCGVFASVKVRPATSLYDIVDEKEPFEVLNDLHKTIIFRVK